ncbi:MAG: class I SAM-dependent methyltransferase, partial [Actinomycetota bacterium]
MGALAEEVHTIDLPEGVTTPGWFDTRTTLAAIPFPGSLEGRRCLDVGTCDGFWAFSMKSRGAHEVVGIDLDDPAKRDFPELVPQERDDAGRAASAFAIAQRALGMSVERVPMSVYDLTPESVGRFDFAFAGSILLHLRDPVRALATVRSVTTGEAFVCDMISVSLSRLFPRRPAAFLDGHVHPWWWTPNLAGLQRMMHAAGFEVTALG